MINIYALINPLNNQVFYIGATKKPDDRLKQHISSAFTGKDNIRKQLVRTILEEGKTVDMEVLDICDNKDVEFMECFYTDLFKSYGYTLFQRRDWPYRHTTRKKRTAYDWESNQRHSVTLKIREPMLLAMEIVGETFCTTKETMIRVAVRRYLRNVLFSNRRVFDEAKFKLATKFLTDRERIENEPDGYPSQ